MVNSGSSRQEFLQSVVVTAEQMRQIEGRVFAAGMPVAALMEKVAGLITRRIVDLYPWREGLRVGVLVGPGHNGGDALVVARELQLRGYQVKRFQPFAHAKELTSAHAQYCDRLGIPVVGGDALADCDVLVDGLFGFGLERSLTGDLAVTIDQINQWSIPVVSIDLPSGVHTDTGAVLGTALRATQTLCLGLWKQGLLQDGALAWVGQAELIDFDLPVADIQAILGVNPACRRITAATAIAHLPLRRSPTAHKYTQGHLLLIAGSRQYSGAVILAALGARASGVGMVTIAAPESLKPILTSQLPEALVVGCPETASGAIAQLPEALDFTRYGAIACGPGLSLEPDSLLRAVLASSVPLVLDADGLGMLAAHHWVDLLAERAAPTVLTPHPGEFQRLFPDLTDCECRILAVQHAAARTGAIVLLKGARVAIADGATTWINPESTPALARGGSGDVLTGLLGGLVAQAWKAAPGAGLLDTVQAGAGWHAQAGILAAQERTELGVDALTLTDYLLPSLRRWQRPV